jgi:transcriptional regulator with XRE-family HTH domain
MARTLPRAIAAPDPIPHSAGDLGALVRNRRAQTSLRIDDAADQLGVSKSALSRLENGRAVSIETVMKVLHGFGLNMLIVTNSEADEALRTLRPGQEGRT